MSVNHFVLCADGKWRNRRGKVVAEEPPVVEPPETPTMLMGVNDSNFVSLQNKLHAVNPNATLRVRRRYDGAFPLSWSSTSGQNDVGTGVITWLSFGSPTIAQINSGSHDANLATFFASIPSTHKCYITYLHEINLPDKLGSTPPAQFAAAQARIWNIKQANAQNPANVLVGPILTADPYRTGAFTGFYPAGGEFDFIGADPYRFWRDANDPLYQPDPKTGGTGTPRTMAYLLGDPNADGSSGAAAFSASSGKPIAIAEYGAHPTPNDVNNRPNWLVQTDAYLRAHNCMAALYFHAPYGESGPWYIDQFHHYTSGNYHTDRETGPPDPDSFNKYLELLLENNQGAN